MQDGYFFYLEMNGRRSKSTSQRVSIAKYMGTILPLQTFQNGETSSEHQEILDVCRGEYR
jgi:hypothetical protein